MQHLKNSGDDGMNKAVYLDKHIKRNRKWVQDATNLDKGLIKSINYDELCYLQNKMETSIFNHEKQIREILKPLKK